MYPYNTPLILGYVVSLEETLYKCNEEEGAVEVCAVVRSPVECPVPFSFDIRIYTVDYTAGNNSHVETCNCLHK